MRGRDDYANALYRFGACKRRGDAILPSAPISLKIR
jgi:hypothetical protein